ALTRNGGGAAPAVSKLRVYSSIASSPSARTCAAIVPTVSSTSSLTLANCRRIRRATCAGVPSGSESGSVRVKRSISKARSPPVQTLGERVDRRGAQLVSNRIGDQARGAVNDLLAHD